MEIKPHSFGSKFIMLLLGLMTTNSKSPFLLSCSITLSHRQEGCSDAKVSVLLPLIMYQHKVNLLKKNVLTACIWHPGKASKQTDKK